MNKTAEAIAKMTEPNGHTDRLNRAYTERNSAVIGMALMAIAAGYKAGYGIDHDWEKKGWMIEWATVVYIDLPGGKQVSFHMAPEEAGAAQKLLPVYEGEWDGGFLSRVPLWPTQVWS